VYTFENVTFFNNTLRQSAVVNCQSCKNVIIRNCKFLNNTSKGYQSGAYNRAYGVGLQFYNLAGPLVLETTEFIGNQVYFQNEFGTVDGFGAGIYAVLTSTGSISISNCDFVENVLNGYGAGICTWTSSSAPRVVCH